MNTILGKGIPLILYAGPLPCWLIFFVLGVMIGHNRKEIIQSFFLWLLPS